MRKREGSNSGLTTFFLLSLMVAASGAAMADTAAPSTAPTFSGFFDVTYNDNLSGATTNPLRTFDAAANTFLLNDFQLKAAGNAGKEVAYTAKLDMGTDATIIHSNANATSAAGVYSSEIEEAHFDYTPNLMPVLTLTAGKFVTYDGIEVIESGANPTISRGYLFGMAEPYTTTGVKLMYMPSSKFMIGGGVVNGWDLVTDNNTGKTGIAQIAVNLGDPFALSVQGSYGPEAAADASDDRSSVDAVVTTKVIPKVTLAVQGNYGSEPNVVAGTVSTWKGVGVQPIIDLSALIPATSLGLRYENFVNEDKTRFGGITSEANSFTVTPTFAFNSNLTMRVEYRYDQAVDKIFTDSSGKPINNNSTVSGEFIQSF
jgi:hypothetical protein